MKRIGRNKVYYTQSVRANHNNEKGDKVVEQAGRLGKLIEMTLQILCNASPLAFLRNQNEVSRFRFACFLNRVPLAG